MLALKRNIKWLHIHYRALINLTNIMATCGISKKECKPPKIKSLAYSKIILDNICPVVIKFHPTEIHIHEELLDQYFIKPLPTAS